MSDSEYYLEFIDAIDDGAGAFEVSAWEADFIESMLKNRPRRLSERQQETIRRMAKKYLGEDVT